MDTPIIKRPFRRFLPAVQLPPRPVPPPPPNPRRGLAIFVFAVSVAAGIGYFLEDSK